MAHYVQSLSGGNLNMNKPITRTADHENPIGPITLALAKAGTLTTRTDNDTGTITSTAHGYAVNDIVDVYWSGAGNVRYGMTVTSVPTADTFVADGGAGENLPAQASALTVAEQQIITAVITGDLIQIIGVVAEATNQSSTANAHLQCKDAQGETILELDLVANTIRVYDVTGGDTNVFNPSDTATFTAAVTDIVTSTGHGLIEGHQVVLTTTGTLPAGLSLATYYFVKYIDANTFYLSTTLGGAAVNVTDTGSGTHTWTKRNVITKIHATQDNASATMTLKIIDAEDSTS